MSEKKEHTVREDGTVHFKCPVGEKLRTLVFRVPDLEDLAMIDMDLPLLPVEEHEEDTLSKDPTGGLKVILDDPKKTVRFMKRANKMLALVSVNPKFTDKSDTKVDTDDGDEVLSVRQLTSNDRIFIFLALQGLAGFNTPAIAEVAPFVEVASSSSLATNLPDGTESGPTNS